MIRIKSVNIRNFRGNGRELKFTLANGPVTIIFGQNGAGKTTLLRLIFGILSSDSSVLANEKVESASVALFDTESGLQYELGAVYSIDNSEYEWFKSPTSENVDDLLRGLSSIFFGTNRGTVPQAINRVRSFDILHFLRMRSLKMVEGDGRPINTSLVFEEFSEFLNTQARNRRIREQRIKYERSNINSEEKHLNLDNLPMDNVESLLTRRYQTEKQLRSDRVHKALFETLALVVDKSDYGQDSLEELPVDFLERLNIHGGTLVEVLSQLTSRNELSERIIAALKYNDMNDSMNHNPFNGKQLLATLVNNMIDELEKEATLYNSVNELVEYFNGYLEDGKKLSVNEKEVKILTSNGEHPLEALER